MDNGKYQEKEDYYKQKTTIVRKKSTRSEVDYCSETTLTGVSRFHTSTSLGIEPWSLNGNKRVDHWTSGTVYECSEIAGSPHYSDIMP